MLEDRRLADLLLQFEQVRHLVLLWLAAFGWELKRVAIEASLKLFLDLFVPLQLFDRLLRHEFVAHMLSNSCKSGFKYQQAGQIGELKHGLQAFLALVLAVDVAVLY